MKTLMMLILATTTACAEWVVVYQSDDVMVMRKVEKVKPQMWPWGQGVTNMVFTNQPAILTASNGLYILTTNHPTFRDGTLLRQ